MDLTSDFVASLVCLIDEPPCQRRMSRQAVDLESDLLIGIHFIGNGLDQERSGSVGSVVE